MLSTPDEPHCMNFDCKKRWPTNVFHEKMKKSFINGKYKKHRENILMSTQMSMMPHTQNAVKQMILKRELKNNIKDANAEYKRLKQALEKQKELIYILKSKSICEHTEIKQEYNYKCPNEKCNGFFGSEYICGMCESKICNKCFNVECEGHKCDNDDIKTVQLLKKESKPCPGCAALITKIDGCDQMWCVNCHVAFSWRTGAIQNTGIHNPHYYDFIRGNGQLRREAGDNPCGGVPDARIFQRYMFRYKSLLHNTDDDRKEWSKILITIRDLNELEEYIRVFANDHEQRKQREYRVQFMMNEISEAQFKSRLVALEKHIKKKQEYRDIMTTTLHIGSEILRNLNDKFETGQISRNDIEQTNEQILSLSTYMNKQFERIGKYFDNVYPFFETNYHFKHNALRSGVLALNYTGKIN